MRQVKRTTRFKKDFKAAKKRGLPMHKLREIVDLLAADEPLPLRCRNHQLSGTWEGYWECHIQPDWLLVYKLHDDVLVLTLASTGTHSDLFDS